MKAIVQHRYGPPTALSLAEVPAPAVGPRDLRIEVHASTVSQGDRRLRAGDFPGVTWVPGRLLIGLTGPRAPIPGTTFAGRVVELGAEVSRFAVGDDVFGIVDHGAHAEQLVIAEDGAVAHLPDGLGHAEASSLPYGALTALRFLRDHGEVGPGQRVCILGASGGVGRAAVSIAVHLGAEVTAVCSAANAPRVRALGATRVVDYHSEDFRAAGPFDVVFDTIGASSFSESRAALTPSGRYLSLIMTVAGLWRMLISSVLGGPRAIYGVALPQPGDLEELGALAARGVLRPAIDRTFPLEGLPEAHALVESGGARGAVVVTPVAA